MIIKTKKQVSKYDEFFALEADTPAKGTKVRKAKLNDTVTDYTDENDDTQTKQTDTPEDTTTTDYTDENDDDSNETQDDTEADADNSEETDYTDENDDGTTSEDQSSDGETDYTDETNPDNTDDTTSDNPDDSQDGDNEDIQTQKYNLYREFMRLYSSIKRYISKLENTVKDDINGNMVIISVTKKLREIQDLIYEYLTVKFHSTEYSEALLYFHTCIETIELTFKLLKNNEIFIKQ